MTKTYIYQLAPTDWFFPFKTVEQANADIKKEFCEDDIPDVKNELLDKIEAAKVLFRKYTTWEGDGQVYISGLPGEECDSYPLILVIIKQENNGITYLYSPVELPYLRRYLEFEG